MLLVNRIFLPSGDQVGSRLKPDIAHVFWFDPSMSIHMMPVPPLSHVRTYTIFVPSGEMTGEDSDRLTFVSRLTCWPFAFMMYTLCSPPWRLLMNAIRRKSADHDGVMSECWPVVSCVSPEPSGFTV